MQRVREITPHQGCPSLSQDPPPHAFYLQSCGRGSLVGGGPVQRLPANSFFLVGNLIFLASEIPKKKTDRRQTNKSQNFDKIKIRSPHHHKFPISINWFTFFGWCMPGVRRVCAGCATCLAQMAILASARCLKNWQVKFLNGFCDILATPLTPDLLPSRAPPQLVVLIKLPRKTPLQKLSLIAAAYNKGSGR